MNLLRGLAVVFFALGAWAWAGETGEYVNGLEGIKGGSVPPPGMYFRSYNLWYHGDSLRDGKGKEVPIDFNVDVLASAERFIWITDKARSILGCDFGVHAIVPFVYTDVDIGKLGVHDRQFGVGDIDISPVICAWHKDRIDLAVSYEFYMPTGDLDNRHPASSGKEYWTHMFTFGATGYLDKEKTWTLSVLPRYEIHSEKANANYRPGDDFHFEWGVGKMFPDLGLEVGATGYATWQTFDDTGKGVTWDKKVHDKVFAAGPEINYMIKPIKLHAALRWEKEFGAIDRTQGCITTLVFTKRF